MNFEKFTPANSRKVSPIKMHVGQVVVRNRMSPCHVSYLKRKMIEGMEKGMEFSVGRDGDAFAIRRDK